MRRAAVVGVAFWLVSSLILGIGAVGANPSTADAEGALVARVGDERGAAGLAGYEVAADLVDVARRHAEEMRRQQKLHHNPRLGDDVQGWQAVGENVGVGSDVESIHQALMASPSHRDNILSDRFTQIGVGVVADGDDLWIVQVFRRPQASPEPASAPPAEARPEPDPAPTPAGGSGGGGGTVRATSASGAAAGASVPAPTTSVPVPSTTEAPPPTVDEPAEVPTTIFGGAAAEATRAEPTTVPAPTTLSPAPAPSPSLDGPVPSGREVTLPVAAAAGMLVGVVAALTVHVGGIVARGSAPRVAGRRPSLLDAWELGFAR